MDPFKVFPTVRVTVELVQVGVGLTPISAYAKDNVFLLRDGMNEYLRRLHSDNKDSCGDDFVPAVGSLFLLGVKETIEKDLGVNGQLDALLKKSGITMSGQDAQRHFWHVYATFPGGIRKYVIPRGRIVLDEFAFDKSAPTQTHIATIGAIARTAVDIAAHTYRGFVIELAGHTDDRGTENYNANLGLRRASEVKKALREAIDDNPLAISSQINIEIRSFGETKPIAKASTEAGHARNRRVEVLVPPLRPICKRCVYVRWAKRASSLCARPRTPEQAKRIKCLLSKVVEKGTDDRWAPPELVEYIYNNPKPGETGPFRLLRDQLSAAGIFGPAASDVSILRSLEQIDGKIIEGMGEVNKRIQFLLGSFSRRVHPPVFLPMLMRAMEELRAWDAWSRSR